VFRHKVLVVLAVAVMLTTLQAVLQDTPVLPIQAAAVVVQTITLLAAVKEVQVLLSFDTSALSVVLVEL
jgi:hypothetical protein